MKEIHPNIVFGFNGKIKDGLKLHPDKEHIIFAIGSKLSIFNLKNNEQNFLSGHTKPISSLDISVSGKYLTSGQKHHIGFCAYVILWDWETKTEIARHALHKSSVRSIIFTAYDEYSVSLGDEGDESVIVYDNEKRTPLCGANATRSIAGKPSTLCRFNQNGRHFVSGGDRHLRLWHIDNERKRLSVQDICVGKLQRYYTGVQIDLLDEILYAGTMSGDVIKVKLNCSCKSTDREKSVLLGCYARHNPKKPKLRDCERYVCGVRAIQLMEDEQLLITAGDGAIEMVKERKFDFRNYKNPSWPGFRKINESKVKAPISSILKLNDSIFLIGTENCEIYSLCLNDFRLKLLKTCVESPIRDIAFPKNFSLVFATASYETIRLWSMKRHKEILRITVHNFTAGSIVFSYDGKSLISAWNDGKLRTFNPVSGELLYTIENAHNKGCTAVTVSSTDRVLVSGGYEGQVRVWKIEPNLRSLIAVLKEHSAPITSIDFNRSDTEILSASCDGTCVIWDIQNLCRKQVLYAKTQFTCARYHPTYVQVLTAGTDKRIHYWEVYDGSLIREVDGSKKGPINWVEFNRTGEYFLSVASDQSVKLWDYKKGIPIAFGFGHADAVLICQFSPCGEFFVTGSSDGSIIIWNIPEEFKLEGATSSVCVKDEH